MRKTLLITLLAALLPAVLFISGCGGGGNDTASPDLKCDLTASVVTNSTIKLQWTRVSGNLYGWKFAIFRATGYTAQDFVAPPMLLDGSLMAGEVRLAILGPDTSSYIDNTSQFDIDYVYILALTDGTSCKWGEKVNFEVLYDGGPTTAIKPTDLMEIMSSASYISLLWRDNANNEDGFKIERSTSSSSGFVQVGSVGANVTNWIDSGLSAGTTYYYRVCAYKGSNNSSYSNIALATTQIATPPPVTVTAPSNLTATATSSSSISLNWADNSNNEDGFKIEQVSSDYPSYHEVGSTGANITNFSATGLLANHSYTFRVCACKGSAYSDYSNVATAATQNGTTPPPVTVTAPSNLTATATSASAISLTWSDNSNNEDGFKIEQSLSSSSGFSEIGSVGTNVGGCNVSSLSASTTYYYRVRGYKGSVYSNYSNISNATTQSVTPPPSGNWSGTIACFDQTDSVTGKLYFVTPSGKTDISDVADPDSVIKFSPNRQYIAARTNPCDVSYPNRLIFFNRSGQQVGWLKDYKANKQFCWLNDSSGVLAALRYYWDGSTGESWGLYKTTLSTESQLTRDIAGASYGSLNPAISCDGQWIYVSSMTDTGANVYKISVGSLSSGNQFITSVGTKIYSTSLGGQANNLIPLASGKLIIGGANQLLIFNPSNNTIEAQISINTMFTDLKISSDGTKLVYSDAYNIYIYNTSNLTLNRNVSTGFNCIKDVAFSPDGSYIAVAGCRTSTIAGLYVLPIGGSMQTVYELATTAGPRHLDWAN